MCGPSSTPHEQTYLFYWHSLVFYLPIYSANFLENELEHSNIFNVHEVSPCCSISTYDLSSYTSNSHAGDKCNSLYNCMDGKYDSILMLVSCDEYFYHSRLLPWCPCGSADICKGCFSCASMSMITNSRHS